MGSNSFSKSAKPSLKTNAFLKKSRIKRFAGVMEPFWRASFGFFEEINETSEVNGELRQHCEDGVHVEDVGERSFG